MAKTHEYLDPDAERIEVPLDGGRVVGNLRRPAGEERPPLVLLVPGLDSTKEEFFKLENVFLDRGMATLSIDGPGQGESGYELPIRAGLRRGRHRGARRIAGRDGRRPRPRRPARGEPRRLLRAAGAGVRAAREGGRGAERARTGSATSGTTCRRRRARRSWRSRSRRTTRRGARRRPSSTSSGVAERIQQPYLAITGKLDRLIPWEQTERAARRGAERDVPAARGRQPRLRERPVQDAARGGRLASRAARMSGIAIVGTGMWAPRLAAAAERAGLELVTCFSRDEERRAGVRRALRLRAGGEPGGRDRASRRRGRGARDAQRRARGAGAARAPSAAATCSSRSRSRTAPRRASACAAPARTPA